ncbi:carboxylesterase [Alteromonas sediminis]|uniref:Carboxylesterase n=1 Tax=Alteromonas sediminis TaxID=2259342 RepID=A0A3N5Y587_9ALTE|nr:alpha/beta hydrolase fold domain-containing protein [Alteromonas sediminis]RPJ65379.1 carboxylesterase [Alteromonas sediminis]
MTANPLEFVEINPEQSPVATVIWLHGLGDSGHGFAPIVPELKLPESLPIRFVFPHAPERSVTINAGMRMRAWYDIVTMDFNHRADRAGVEESAGAVYQLLSAEIAKGIPPEKIILAGFSQGGVIALHMAARIKEKLAGIMALSTYMCEPDSLREEATDTNKSTPILMAHGQHDDVVPVFLGNAACKTLQENGFNVDWHVYPMQHNVCFEELQQIRQFIIDVLTPQESAE